MNAPAPDFLETFRRVGSALPGQRLGWLQHARAAAIERFGRRGFPSLRDEDWKYTSVAAIERSRFKVLPAPCSELLVPLIAAHALPDSHLLVFVNGRFDPALSRLGRLPAGITLGNLAYRLEHEAAGLETALVDEATDTPFADLNLAFAADGAYIDLAPGTRLKTPIQLLFLATEAGLAVHPRNLVRAAADSSACIVEHHVGHGETPYLTNAVTDIALAPGAALEHYKLQQESPAAYHIAAVNVRQQAKSRFVSGAYAFGARLARVGITVGLDAEGANCSLDGLYVGGGRQHLDHHTSIEHRRPGCTSREFYKGVLDGGARAVFNGRIVVDPDAQRSDAFQTNHNLLLSDLAEIDTKPQLEIWADDVKCSHGATVGQLDEDQVFYLRSRGIDGATARAVLTRAFAMEIVDRVGPMSLQARLDEVLQAKLPQLGSRHGR